MKAIRTILLWTPRGLAILFAAFISIFALDVFGEGYAFWETILALVIHLIPTGIILVALALAWRLEWLGAILFAVLGTSYVIMTRGRFDLTTYLIVAGPSFLISILFLASWLTGRQAKKGAQGPHG